MPKYRLRRLANIIVVAAFVGGCSSWSQTSEQVSVRAPGHRVYGDPAPVKQEAANHWEFALLSYVAYSKVEANGGQGEQGGSGSSKAVISVDDISTCNRTPALALENAGWVYWADFPDAQLKQELAHSNLRVEVWQKKDPPAVAVAFGGTVFTSRADWEANLRWFIPHHKDEYTELVERVVPAFIGRYAEVTRNSATEKPPIYSTGHSLGGGLAQEFAYALPRTSSDPKVTKVFAFDPSPVTGYYSIDPDIRQRGTDGLQIDRVFERGEILAALRSALALVYPPSTNNPTVRAVRYNFDGVANPVSAHSMARLACELYSRRPSSPTASESVGN
jgi:hypothetical protein